MERVYTNYTASDRQVVLNNVPSSFASITTENIRLIFNETQKNEKGEALDPLASTGCKENILSVTYNSTAKTVTIVLADTVPVIAPTDKLTIKIDMGDGLENMGSAIIEIDTSLLALESTTAKEATVAKEAQATLNKQAIIDAIIVAQEALKGNDDAVTLTAIQTLISTLSQSIPTVQQIQSGLALESQTKDGNDTAVSVAKEVRSEVGTGSDTIAESGTLFAVVKWIKNKVKDIYNAITDSTNGLSAIKTDTASAASDAAAAKVAAQNAETTAQATANKNEIIAHIQANAGIPTLTIPDSTAIQELAPNVLYIFETRTSTLTLALGTPIVGIANEYHFFVVCGSTAPTINFPSGISWNGENTPEIAVDKTYEISILNNIATFFEI